MGVRFYGHIVSQKQADGILREPSTVWSLFTEPPTDERDSIDLDKAWHGLHWLLCGDADVTYEPASWSMFAGTALAVDQYPAPRVLGADGVAAVHQVLSATTEADLEMRYNGPAMMRNQIYPAVWTRPDEPGDYLAHYFRILVAFYRRAAERGAAIVQYVG